MVSRHLLLFLVFITFIQYVYSGEQEEFDKLYIEQQHKDIKTLDLKGSIYAEYHAAWPKYDTEFRKPHYQAKKDLYDKRTTFQEEKTKERAITIDRVKEELTKSLPELAAIRSRSAIDECRSSLRDLEKFFEMKYNAQENDLDGIRGMTSEAEAIGEWIAEKKQEIDLLTEGDKNTDRLQKELHLISRQAQLAQFNEEEKRRSDGNSGIKQIRTTFTGEESYNSNTHNSKNSIAAIHDHSNNIRTVGMGEIIAVLNGVEFRTRHNDYRLYQPSTTTSDLHKVEDIQFPDVPEEVTSKSTIDEQVVEMQEWFKAFHNQDYSIRDYRKYFPAVLCYLEGAWMTQNGDDIEEPFESDRHSLDAKTWFELTQKIQYTSYTGGKSRFENLAHLPTTIMDFTDDGKPIFAQWNYRILCHPLSKDLPTKYFKLLNETATLKRRAQSYESYQNSRSARFDLFGIRIDGRGEASRQERGFGYNLVDELMQEIPGKDNYPADIIDNGFDAAILNDHPLQEGESLNAGYYHRPYQLNNKDAMGVSGAQRGFSDIFYFALTEQARVSGPSITKEVDGEDKKIKIKGSYAIPLEIIYMTPLGKWNPFGLPHFSDKNKQVGDGKETSPLETTTEALYYQTPAQFFTGPLDVTDNADTAARHGLHVKGSKGSGIAFPSGTRILFPKINLIGDDLVRQRYPIAPVFGEGSSVWKKINAIQDSLAHIIQNQKGDVEFYGTGISHNNAVTTTHSHIMSLDKVELDELKSGIRNEISVTADLANGHQHFLKIAYNSVSETLYIVECDGNEPDADDYVCFDQHDLILSTSQ